ncbi:MAG: carbamoyltransferase HypF, partial [Spirochaetota bacterium]
MENLQTGATITVSGIVQGVGFRPYIYRKARLYNLDGAVQNTPSGVEIRVDGEEKQIQDFFNDLVNSPPVLAEIHQSSIRFHPPVGFEGFVIQRSEEHGQGFSPVSPDIATCRECVDEVFDPSDRRYRYPFTNCTNCGPRFTIIQRVPYDRKNTTMKVFNMCSRCQKEYSSADDRRYHAQPNACPVCGPELVLLDSEGVQVNGEPIQESVRLLKNGRILAIKGLGGYHLAVDPHIPRAVRLLRERKKRPGKPFAMMARDMEVIEKYCEVSAAARKLLCSFQRPILLLERKTGVHTLAPEVAPDTRTLGMMLPYTPVHHLLLSEGPEVLVMTSANISEEPLVYKDRDAFSTLKGIADFYLTHNRDIQRPCDDSVLGEVDWRAVPIRRSRGYVPRAIHTGISRGEVLAAGALEKNTFCVTRDAKAYLSHHIGDLNNEKSVDAYTRGIQDFCSMFRINPEALACDMHPDYFSTVHAEKLSRELRIPLFYIQHHHAHIASVLGERNVQRKVIGIALDGTGYGPD